MEHYFVDFQYLILGEKMKRIGGYEHNHGVDYQKFDDEYFSKLMITSDESNLEFYE